MDNGIQRWTEKRRIDLRFFTRTTPKMIISITFFVPTFTEYDQRLFKRFLNLKAKYRDERNLAK